MFELSNSKQPRKMNFNPFPEIHLFKESLRKMPPKPLTETYDLELSKPRVHAHYGRVLSGILAPGILFGL